ncbi:hypothetical protein IEQ34_024042 [Dendrobium chrysotoxum]|uniref:Uncharacterized protein n=1 Tax=Dendrobium chrysotoxum TaxID=161865 RepID=A0AAV7FUK3_DENCH|nr:hypothetical protein IEQ34_024042 [Dendrobium chrysotoxum]
MPNKDTSPRDMVGCSPCLSWLKESRIGRVRILTVICEYAKFGLFAFSFFSGMPLREQGAPRAERENEVFCDVGICTYFDLFSDQSASFFDPARSSFSICFQ